MYLFISRHCLDRLRKIHQLELDSVQALDLVLTSLHLAYRRSPIMAIIGIQEADSTFPTPFMVSGVCFLVYSMVGTVVNVIMAGVQAVPGKDMADFPQDQIPLERVPAAVQLAVVLYQILSQEDQFLFQVSLFQQ